MTLQVDPIARVKRSSARPLQLFLRRSSIRRLPASSGSPAAAVVWRQGRILLALGNTCTAYPHGSR